MSDTVSQDLDSQTNSRQISQSRSCFKWQSFVAPLLPFIGIVASLPYLILYLVNLWELSHYQFFPLLLAAIGYLIRTRWSNEIIQTQTARTVTQAGWIGGVIVAMAAALFASPWLGYLAFLFFFAGWLWPHIDRETGRSLGPLVIPLLLIWQPPFSSVQTGDAILIAKLQLVSSQLSSMGLDMLGFLHNSPGTVLEFAGKSFGVAEACSGIQSFFALLCFAALIVVFQRRGLIHSIILLTTSVFWAVLMNTVRITAIPIAFTTANLDLTHGLIHDILGYTTMGLALLMLVSTDYLLTSIFKTRTQAWLDSELPAYKPYVNHPFKDLTWQWAVVGVLTIVFSLQSYDVASSVGYQRDKVSFFREDVLVDLSESVAPVEIEGWKLVSYKHEDRDRGADLGQRSDSWNYRTNFGSAILSFDQAFPGWHELTVCYQYTGYELLKRNVLQDPESLDWPIVSAELKNANGQYGFLVYGLFDRSGRPLQAPGQWNGWTGLQERIKNRLSPAVRGSLFGLAAYQVQVFIPSTDLLSNAEKDQAISNFSRLREMMRSAAGDSTR